MEFRCKCTGFHLQACKVPDSQNLCASCRGRLNSPPLRQLLIVKYTNRADGEDVLNCCNSCFYCLVPNDEGAGGLSGPAQKRIQATDSCRGELKILDSCSNSQIHLWSNTKSGESYPFYQKAVETAAWSQTLIRLCRQARSREYLSRIWYKSKISNPSTLGFISNPLASK
jgi:hypothetical protein